MTQLTDIVEIQITRETAAVAQTNFNVPAFIFQHTVFQERAREYTSLEAVADDFPTTSAGYIAASKFFGQQIRPTTIVIGRRQVPSTSLQIGAVTVGAVFTVTINGNAYSYTAIALDTETEVAEALETAINAASLPGITALATLGVLVVTSTVDWSISVSTNITKTDAFATETWPATIEAVQDANDTWYALTTNTHVKADVLAIAGAIEAKRKIYGFSTSDADVKTTATDDVMSSLQDLSYQRTFGLWSATADTEFPECAWIGFQLQERPGSNTWAYKTLAGVTVSTLTDTESTNIKAKGGNTYERIGGLNVTVGGNMAGGEWIDTMVFVDWLEARLRERIWFRLANSKKIPYTQAGATIIETEVRAQLREGIRVGGLADSPAPVVRVPDVLTIAPNLRAQRIFDGIEFEARLAGAIHYVTIRGVVSV